MPLSVFARVRVSVSRVTCVGPVRAWDEWNRCCWLPAAGTCERNCNCCDSCSEQLATCRRIPCSFPCPFPARPRCAPGRVSLDRSCSNGHVPRVRQGLLLRWVQHQPHGQAGVAGSASDGVPGATERRCWHCARRAAGSAGPNVPAAQQHHVGPDERKQFGTLRKWVPSAQGEVARIDGSSRRLHPPTCVAVPAVRGGPPRLAKRRCFIIVGDEARHPGRLGNQVPRYGEPCLLAVAAARLDRGARRVSLEASRWLGGQQGL